MTQKFQENLVFPKRNENIGPHTNLYMNVYSSILSSNDKESACKEGDHGSIPGSGRSPGGHGNPLQYSCLENPMDRGAWWGTVHGVTKSWT